MRYSIVLTVVFALVALLLGNAGAAGMVVMGKEPCDCPSLVARGIIPDPLNRIADMLYFPQVASALDSVAVEVRAMLTQPSAEENGASVAETEEEGKESKGRSALEEKPPKEETPAKEAVRTSPKKKPVAHAKKSGHKKRKVKVPARAM